jgi:hypothetical protein
MPKRPDLANVIYPGGLEVHRNGMATLTVGDGDVETHRAVIPIP